MRAGAGGDALKPAGAGRDLPLGFLSPDGTTLYALAQARGRMLVRAYDVETGSVLRSTSVDGDYFVPADPAAEQDLAISRDGRRMILKAGVSEAEEKKWIETGRPRSRYAVLDTAFVAAPAVLDLDGEFWFDGLSADGAWLYLIEIQDEYPMSYSPGTPPQYQVRAYDVKKAELTPDPIVDKRDLEQMNGYRQGTAFSPGGDWLYSVCTRKRRGIVRTRPERGQPGRALH